MRVRKVRSHAVVRFMTSRSDPFGLSLADPFGNSLADSVSFRLPSRLSLDGAPLLPVNSAHGNMAPREEFPKPLWEGREKRKRC